MARKDKQSERHVDRRVLLTGIAGMMGLAGCSSQSDNDTEETTTSGDPPEDDAEETISDEGQPGDERTMDTTESDDRTSEPGSTDVRTCSMLSGSFTRFEPGSEPLPFSFEYPSEMSDTVGFAYPNQLERTPGVTARIERGSDANGDGDIRLSVDISYEQRTENGRDTWYENAEGEVFATAQINGEAVDFIYNPNSLRGDDNNAFGIDGMFPYSGSTGTTYHLTSLSVAVRLIRSDADSVTETCSETLRETLRRLAESMEFNDATTFEQYF
jgi:hypothetical protein